MGITHFVDRVLDFMDIIHFVDRVLDFMDIIHLVDRVSDFMDMMMLQNAQMHHMVMQQMMLQNLPGGGGGSFRLPTAQIPMAPVLEPMVRVLLCCISFCLSLLPFYTHHTLKQNENLSACAEATSDGSSLALERRHM